MNSRYRPARLASPALVAFALVAVLGACQGGDEPESASLDWTDEDPMGYAEALAQCARDRGFEATVYDDASIGGGGGLEVMRECTAEVGEIPWRDLPDEELRLRYDWRVEQDLCLRDLGLDFPEPPSFETFRADAEELGDIPWDPLTWAASELFTDGGEVDPLVYRATSECPYSVEHW